MTQIQDHFRLRIRRQEIRPGEKLPSMRQLSESCGVSLGIVKQALTTLVTEGYLRSHPGRGVFVAEPRLTRQNIALVLPSLDTEQMPNIIRGVKEALADGSGRLIVQAADFDFDQEMDLLTNLDTTFVAGAIIYPPPLKSYLTPLEELKRRGVPFVLVDTYFDSLAVDSVTSDRVELAKLAFEYLVDQGHRKIGVVDHDGDAISIQQLREGADLALRKVGLRYDDLPCVRVKSRLLDHRNPWAQGEAGARQVLAEHPELTAITGINDNISMGAFRAVKAAGLRVPEDMSVIAIGDLTSFQATEPALTAVAQGHQVMGRLAALRLMRLLDRNGTTRRTGPHRIRVKPKLRVRGSVGPPRSEVYRRAKMTNVVAPAVSVGSKAVH